uniref:Uncharacterized protein n=1 Tax=Arundo donax TaxID=35708 RepID=A0A0A8Z2M5_ARUDO
MMNKIFKYIHKDTKLRRNRCRGMKSIHWDEILKLKFS